LTVIVAARTGKNRVTIAADSEVTSGWQKGNVSRPKLWADKGYAFGAAGSLRTAQVIRHHVEWPRYTPDDGDFETFLIRKVVPEIQFGVASHGVVAKRKGVEVLPCWLVIACGPHLAQIEADYCVIGDPTGRLATGSGYAEALGSLGDEGPWTERDVVEAARRASVTAVGVGGPINVVDTKRLEVTVSTPLKVDDLD
jgi:hypothetical protein